MIKVLRMDGILMIGEVEANKMSNPRALVMTQQGLGFQELVGRPEELYFNTPETPAMQYEPEKALVDAYRQHVTGLVIASNVVELKR